MPSFRLSTVDYVKSAQQSVATLSLDGRPSRIVVYDHVADEIACEVEPDIPHMCVDLSADGRFLAVGYWDRPNIDVWETATGDLRTVESPKEVSRLRFDQTANWLVFQSERGTHVVSMTGMGQTRISHVEDLDRSARRTRDNVMIIPLRRKGQVAVVSFSPVRVETVVLPIASVIRDMKHSPADNSLFVIDGSGCVYCYDDELHQLAWKTVVPERPFTGAYCGDGSMIGLHSTKFSGPSNVVVVDAKTGSRLASYPERTCIGHPFMDDAVLLSGGWPGHLLHLRDGSMEEGFAAKFGGEYRRCPIFPS